VNDDADRWRAWALGTIEYLPWRKVRTELGEDPEAKLEDLTDEHLRALFSFTLGFALASAYRDSRAQVVRELAGLAPLEPE
jgi:hypothetical protein